MPARKVQEIKRCKDCGKLINKFNTNKSGFCNVCFQKKYRRKHKRRKNG